MEYFGYITHDVEPGDFTIEVDTETLVKIQPDHKIQFEDHDVIYRAKESLDRSVLLNAPVSDEFKENHRFKVFFEEKNL